MKGSKKPLWVLPSGPGDKKQSVQHTLRHLGGNHRTSCTSAAFGLPSVIKPTAYSMQSDLQLGCKGAHQTSMVGELTPDLGLPSITQGSCNLTCRSLIRRACRVSQTL